MIGAVGDLRRDRAQAADAEEAASYELTASARRFARRARSASNDKLGFSATLMRAGEVVAATRMIEELHDDVRTEEAALMERVNEVKLARAATREKVTRLRLASVLATALLGAGSLSLAAAGMAARSFMADLDTSAPERARAGVGRVLQARHEGGSTRSSDRGRKVVVQMVAGRRITMTPAQFWRYRDLMTRSADRAELESFLARLLPRDEAELVSRVLAATIARAQGATGAAQEVAGEVARKVPKKVKSKVAKAPEKPAAASADQDGKGSGKSPSSEPSPSPSPSPSEGGSSDDSDEGVNSEQGLDGVDDMAPDLSGD